MKYKEAMAETRTKLAKYDPKQKTRIAVPNMSPTTNERPRAMKPKTGFSMNINKLAAAKEMLALRKRYMKPMFNIWIYRSVVKFG